MRNVGRAWAEKARKRAQGGVGERTVGGKRGKSLRSRATERPQEKEKAERGLRGGRIRSKGGKQRFRERRGGMEVGYGAAVVEARAAERSRVFSRAAGRSRRRGVLRCGKENGGSRTRCRSAERPCGVFGRGRGRRFCAAFGAELGRALPLSVRARRSWCASGSRGRSERAFFRLRADAGTTRPEPRDAAA